MSNYPLNANWTDDCCGKKDYDGSVLAINTRYWPDYTAHCSLCIVSKEPEYNPGNYTAIADERFEGKSLEDVKSQVEKWAQSTMDRAIKALQVEFKVPENPTN